MKQVLPFILSIVLSLIAITDCFGSHVLNGNLTYRHLYGNEYECSLTIYQDLSSISHSSISLMARSSSCRDSVSGVMNIGAGPQVISPVNNLCSGAAISIAANKVIYLDTLVLPPCDDWEIVAELPCCTQGGSVVSSYVGGSFFYAELNNQQYSNSSPEGVTEWTKTLCVGGWSELQLGLCDPDGDSIIYSLTNPYRVSNYYNAPFSASFPIPNNGFLGITPNTGEFFISATAQGRYLIAIRADEYRNGVFIGSSDKLLNLLIIPCPIINNPPKIAGPTNITGGIQRSGCHIEVCTNSTLQFELAITDQDTSQSVWTWDSIPLPGAVRALTGTGNNKTSTVSWQTPAQPGLYPFGIVAYDSACPMHGEVGKLLYIRVIDRVSIEGGLDSLRACLGDPVKLSASGGNIFGWSVIQGDMSSLSGINVQSSSIEVSPSSTTMYRVINMLPCGSFSTDSITVIVHPGISSVNVTGNNPICKGDLLSLQVITNGVAGNQLSYQWAPDTPVVQFTNNFRFRPNSSEDYYLEITESPSGCKAYDTVAVSVGGTFSPIAIQASSAYCPGSTPVELSVATSSGPASCDNYQVAPIPYDIDSVLFQNGTVIPLGQGSTHNPIPLGFSFPFDCQQNTHFDAGSNGWISFGSPLTSLFNGGIQLPDTSIHTNGIAYLGGAFFPGNSPFQ
ncbi:MAG: hypothetical protein AB8F95_07420, partial [Bacteroidia bacterium]